MPSSLNTTFKALKNVKPDDQLRDLVLSANEFGRENANYGAFTNNRSQTLQEEVELKKTLQGLKSLLKTEEKATPRNLHYKIRKMQNAADKDDNLFKFSTPNCDKETVTQEKYLAAKEPPQNQISQILDSYKQESFESDEFMPSSSLLPSFTDTHTHHHLNLNFVTLIGLVAGLLVSKLLNSVDAFLLWLLRKILQTRNYFMGSTSVWKLLNLDDTNRPQITRSKLFLLPVILVCCCIYNLIDMLHFVARFLLAAAPNNLIQLVLNFLE